MTQEKPPADSAKTPEQESPAESQPNETRDLPSATTSDPTTESVLDREKGAEMFARTAEASSQRNREFAEAFTEAAKADYQRREEVAEPEPQSVSQQQAPAEVVEPTPQQETVKQGRGEGAGDRAPKEPKGGGRSRQWRRQKLLINADLPGETRVAVVEGNRLRSLTVEREDIPEYRHSLFKGKVSKVDNSLNAAFVSIGLEKDGFLPLQENSAGAETTAEEAAALKVGDEILVQLMHEQPGSSKGPLLRRQINLAGKYLVLLPNDPGARRLPGKGSREGDRERMVDLMGRLDLPQEVGFILRRRALDAKSDLVQGEAADLLATWRDLEQQAAACSAPQLLLLDGDLISRTVREKIGQQVERIIVDDEVAFGRIRALLGRLMPEFVQRLELHDGSDSLFHAHNVERDLEQTAQRRVELPSGGEIVIDRTEALTAVDVNSRAARNKEGMEALARKTNLEAVAEIARQLQLRDIGGLVVIDFIDIESEEARRELEERAAQVLEADSARTSHTPLSSLGLMELSRQRVGMELAHSDSLPCATCDGKGWVQDDYSFALKLLREARSKARDSDHLGGVQLQVPFRIANLLNNELRNAVAELERRLERRLVVLAHPYREPPWFKLSLLKKGAAAGKGSSEFDFADDSQPMAYRSAARNARMSPLVRRAEPAAADAPPGRPQATPADPGASAQPSGLNKWLRGLLSGGSARAPAKKQPRTAEKGSEKPPGRSGGSRRRGRRKGSGQAANKPGAQAGKGQSARQGSESQDSSPKRANNSQPRRRNGRKGSGGRQASEQRAADTPGTDRPRALNDPRKD